MKAVVSKGNVMGFFKSTARFAARMLPRTGRHAASGMQTEPERMVLGVRHGVTPSGRPPVRIFVGTEPAQYRAERVFIWSIEQAREPSRVYEIYLMKELTGFKRRRWLTGFTNYRFAIPHFAKTTGRAIYNDVDQIYLADPGELFDTDLGRHGFLALSDRDTSVMLLDCAAMASVWRLEEAQCERRKNLEAKARAVSGLWGPLDRAWHARDQEYVPGYSKLLHYTAIHMQPWQPLPRRYAYQRHPVGQVWLDLERAADAAGYQVFTAAHPSAQYRALRAQFHRDQAQIPATPRRPPTLPSDHLVGLQELSTAVQAQTLLEYGLGVGAAACLAEGSHDRLGLTVTRYDRASPPSAAPPCGRFDGVICTQGWEVVPDADVPWVLGEIFGYATRFVYIVIAQAPLTNPLPDGSRPPVRRRTPTWWDRHIAAAAACHPKIHWKLEVQSRTALGHKVAHRREGGRCLHGAPIVWLLTDGHPGNTSQSLGLVQALGWPYEVKELRFTPLLHLHDALFGACGATRLGLNKTGSASLSPPWPDLIITTGWRTAHVARWIRKQSQGRTRLVQLGRRGSQVAAWFDAAVSCAHFRFPPHPRRIETVAPLSHITPELLEQAAEGWQDVFKTVSKPHIALLVGGTSSVYRLDAETAERLGQAVRTFAQAAGGSVFATTSRRTGLEAPAALRRGLGDCSYVHPVATAAAGQSVFGRGWPYRRSIVAGWQPRQPDNPYLAYLGLADVLVVTGDSESMLAEAVATGRPVYIYPLPERYRVLDRLKEWVVTRSQSARWNHRGTRKPQRRLAYVCARLIEHGMVMPPNDLNALHQVLVDLGVARFFGAPLNTEKRPALRETEDVASRIRALVGLSEG
ncbi:hypothetical protein NKDENANG_01667 [Candidatus Entotheonellaceae bacterium PAL068K]